MPQIPISLRDNKIWKDTYDIAQFIYAKVDELNEHHPDEKWDSVSKLKSSAIDSIYYISQAVGSMEADAAIYEWNSARKSLFALQSIYLFDTKQNMLDLEPSIIVKIDKLISEIDIEIANANRVSKQITNEDLEPWLKKYEIWRKLQSKP